MVMRYRICHWKSPTLSTINGTYKGINEQVPYRVAGRYNLFYGVWGPFLYHVLNTQVWCL